MKMNGEAAFLGRRLVSVGTRVFNRLRTVLRGCVDYSTLATLFNTDGNS